MTTPLNLFALEREARHLSHRFQDGERDAVVQSITAFSAAAAGVIIATMVADWFEADRDQACFDVGYLTSALARRGEPDLL